MTGPGHYREAESLINRALEASDGEVPTCWSFDDAIRTAQVHATLALAAATALEAANYSAPDYQAWYKAASEGPGHNARIKAAREAEAAELAELAEEARS